MRKSGSGFFKNQSADICRLQGTKVELQDILEDVVAIQS